MTPMYFENREDFLHCFSRSFVKFYGHTSREIDDFMDLNPNWARLLGRSQVGSEIIILHVQKTLAYMLSIVYLERGVQLRVYIGGPF